MKAPQHSFVRINQGYINLCLVTLVEINGEEVKVHFLDERIITLSRVEWYKVEDKLLTSELLRD